jgi:hypothetical protein
MVCGAYVHCPACDEPIALGPGGALNLLKQHIPSKKCKENCGKKAKTDLKQTGLHKFLTKPPPTNPALAAPPLPLPQTIQPAVEPLSKPLSPTHHSNCSSSREPAFLVPLIASAATIPDSVPEGSTTDAFVTFSGNLSLLVDDGMGKNEVWEEIVSPKLHSVFWEKTADQLVPVIRRGAEGA